MSLPAEVAALFGEKAEKRVNLIRVKRKCAFCGCPSPGGHAELTRLQNERNEVDALHRESLEIVAQRKHILAWGES